MVLRGGENVYCAEVEAAIYEHPAVYEAAVFGVPHERLGEEVAAAVLPQGRARRSTAEELQAHVAERLAPFKVPTRVVHRRRAAAPQRRRQDPQARAPRRARSSLARPESSTSSSSRRASSPRSARSSDTSTMPPESPTACAHVSTCACGELGVLGAQQHAVGVVEPQPAVLELARHGVAQRVGDRRRACRRSRPADGRGLPPRRHVGADAHAVDHADARARAARRSRGGTRRRRHRAGWRRSRRARAAPACGVGSCHCPANAGRVGEVELQVAPAHRDERAGQRPRGGRAPRGAWCRARAPSPPHAGLTAPTSCRPGRAATSQSGWAAATADDGEARNGASQMPGTKPAAAMSAASSSSGDGNVSAHEQPVADGGLVAVVDLEDVDGPVAGEGEVVADVGLGDVVEVLVPGAPADLERRVDAARTARPPTGPRRRGRRRRAPRGRPPSTADLVAEDAEGRVVEVAAVGTRARRRRRRRPATSPARCAPRPTRRLGSACWLARIPQPGRRRARGRRARRRRPPRRRPRLVAVSSIRTSRASGCGSDGRRRRAARAPPTG